MRYYRPFQFTVINNVAELSASADVCVNNPHNAMSLTRGLLRCAEVDPKHYPTSLVVAVITALEAGESLEKSFVYTVRETEYQYDVKVIPFMEHIKVTRVIINVDLYKPVVKVQGACYA